MGSYFIEQVSYPLTQICQSHQRSEVSISARLLTIMTFAISVMTDTILFLPNSELLNVGYHLEVTQNHSSTHWSINGDWYWNLSQFVHHMVGSWFRQMLWLQRHMKTDDFITLRPVWTTVFYLGVGWIYFKVTEGRRVSLENPVVQNCLKAINIANIKNYLHRNKKDA